MVSHLIWSQAVRVLKMTYSDEAARKHWGRALSTFHLVLNVVNTTGGAGDVDIDTVDESEILDHFQNRLEATRSQGRNAGNLSASTLELWHNQGWTDLFKSRWVSCLCRVSFTDIWHAVTLRTPVSTGLKSATRPPKW